MLLYCVICSVMCVCLPKSNPLFVGHALLFKVNSRAVERTSDSSNAVLESGVIPVEAFEMLAITHIGLRTVTIFCRLKGPSCIRFR